MNKELKQQAEILQQTILTAQEILAKLENAAIEQTTYDDVVEKLQPRFYFNEKGRIFNGSSIGQFYHASEAIARRNAIRAKYENIALSVNGREQEEVRKLKDRWYNTVGENGCIKHGYHDFGYNPCIVYFISGKSAKEALRILTEDEFRKM